MTLIPSPSANSRSRPRCLRALAFAGLMCSQTAMAVSYGIYDPRALAMGGATVAAGDTQNAHFYNPALLSFHDEDEDLTQDGRFIVPGLLAMSSEGGKAARNLIEDDMVENITSSIDSFNANPTNEQSQRGLLDAMSDINTAMRDMDENPIELELFTGLSVSEPAEREGGSFYLGLRAIVFGEADVTEEDLALMEDYEEAARFIATSGAEGEQHPELYDGTQLRDPRPELTSQAQISSLAISEWGIAMAKEFTVFNQPVSFGFTPKIVQAEVYRDDVNFIDEVPSYSDNKKSHLTMNFDLGVAAEVYENVRVGFAVRDVMTKSFKSQNGLALNLEPRMRLGVAYVNDWISVGMDVDAKKNKPIATEEDNQELALGVDVRPWKSLSFRTGYRQNFAGESDDVLSFGLRYAVWRLEMELAYAVSDDVEGGALQFGLRF
ncbi:hypothetical protein TDB9533_04491 [Thalassocella blandensis]|nr:hypothetical protein TDB9533_04491 [Thalassocella blandensis]